MGGAWITNGMMPFFLMALGCVVSALGWLAVDTLRDIRGDIKRLTDGQSALNEKMHTELQIMGNRSADRHADHERRIGKLEGHCLAAHEAGRG